MNGFSAADMSTAAANGHAEGYQAGYADAVKADEVGKPAAAQEAVAWQRKYLGATRGGSPVGWHNITREEFEQTKSGKWASKYDVRELYAAPVAAAPVDARTLASAVEKALGWREGKRDAELDSLLEQAMAILNGIPAAPGIYLEQFRELKDKCQRIQENRDFWHGVAEKTREELFQAREELAKRIDASPKGGSTDAKDAARYRWLRVDTPVSAVPRVWQSDDGAFPVHSLHLESLDEAIDAAMQATSAEVGS